MGRYPFNHIYRQQHPPDCDRARLLVTSVTVASDEAHPRGAARMLRDMAAMLMLAYRLNRTLALREGPFTRDGGGSKDHG